MQGKFVWKKIPASSGNEKRIHAEPEKSHADKWAEKKKQQNIRALKIFHPRLPLTPPLISTGPPLSKTFFKKIN